MSKSATAFKQAFPAPTRKVLAGGIAGAITVVLVWLLNAFILPKQTQLPPEIASALTTIISFIVAYFVPPSSSDNIVSV